MTEDGVVAVVRARSIADPVALARTLSEAGIRCVEFTFTLDDVLDAIEAASEAGMAIGAGTVITTSQARDALSAGAQFIVSPVLAPELVAVAPSDVPVILAGFSPTEVHEATQAGAAAVKLFPSRIGGPDYVRDLLGPLPNCRLMPSGGVGPDNAASYLAAGAVAVYAGSSVVPASGVEAGEHGPIRRRAEALVRSIEDHRDGNAGLER
jgi:2-dehydro-3-deoxyphosphogluconate aldolase / (4S)-4-hydroxy-2-oxoglutarate aldolase